MGRSGRSWMGWWYLTIAVGFLVLAIDHLIYRDVVWLIAVRFVIAAGFGFLGWMELRGKRTLK